MERVSALTCEELKQFRIIHDGEDSSYQLTSYDLRLGLYYYVFDLPTEPNISQIKNESKWQLVYIESAEKFSCLNKNAVESQKYDILKTLQHILTVDRPLLN